MIGNTYIMTMFLNSERQTLELNCIGISYNLLRKSQYFKILPEIACQNFPILRSPNFESPGPNEPKKCQVQLHLSLSMTVKFRSDCLISLRSYVTGERIALDREEEQKVRIIF